MNKYYTLFLPLVCTMTMSNAFVYRMELWEDAHHTTIITLSDWHVDTLSISTTVKQKQDIIALLQQTHAYGIFEDVGWYNGNNPEILKALKWTRNVAYSGQKLGWLIPAWVEGKVSIQRASPLFDITSQARHQGINCESIEFRHALNWAKDGYPILLKDVVDELETKTKEIQAYHDDETMKEIYDFLLTLHFKYNTETINLLQKAAQNPPYTVAALPKHQHYHLESCGHVLLDMEILHALYTQLKSGKKIILIYAGGDHITGIHYGLERMGFKEKAHLGEQITYGISDAQLRERIKGALDIQRAYEQLKSQSQKSSEEAKS